MCSITRIGSRSSASWTCCDYYAWTTVNKNRALVLALDVHGATGAISETMISAVPAEWF